MYSADKPIKTCDADLLDRGNFSHQLAEAIINLPPTDTFVVGLYGEWGSGKTSVLNLTEVVLRDLSGKENNPKVTTVRFNPWGYTDGSQLIQQFFSVLSSELQSNTKGNKRKVIGDALEKYSFVLSYLKYIPVVGPFLTEMPELANKIGAQLKEGVLSNENNIQYQKGAVEKVLSTFHKRIIIIIDDIDRLPNDQIRMIFQLVNSVADFPNITYLLSFDKDIVVRALREVQNCIGEEYLKKIIQFPISLPEISGDGLFDILRIEINKVLNGTNQDLFEKDHWNQVILKCVYPFIRSIRDMRRYINTLYFKYLPLKNNINPSDFAGITALEVFEHQIYEWIISKQAILTSTYDDEQPQSNSIRESEKNNWYMANKDKCLSSPEIVLKAIIVLFPKYASRFETPYEGLESSEYDRLLRICSKQRFQSYFTLSLGNLLVSHETRILSYTSYNNQELSNYFNELVKNDLTHKYLQETLISINSIPEERRQLFAELLFDNIGALSKQEKEMLSYSSYSLCLSILSNILLGIPSEESRLSITLSKITQSTETNLFACAQLIHNMEVTLGRFGSKKSREDKIVFSSKSIESIERCFIGRIYTLPDQSNILRSEHLVFIDYLWKNIDPQGHNEKMKLLLSNPKNILLYTANKARRFVSLFEGTVSWSFDIARDFTYLLTVSDVIQVIKSENFRLLIDDFSLELTTKLAAYFLLFNNLQKDYDKGISNSAAEELALSWIKNNMIES